MARSRTLCSGSCAERTSAPPRFPVFCASLLLFSPIFFLFALSVCASLPQLSLWTLRRQSSHSGHTISNPDTGAVRALWRMSRDKRLQVWRILGRFREVKQLELGGEHGFSCPVDAEELFSLLPEGADPLAQMGSLLLWSCTSCDDAFLRALSAAGCGASLTSLALVGTCSFSFSAFSP